jgi:hypothetical protein
MNSAVPAATRPARKPDTKRIREGRGMNELLRVATPPGSVGTRRG